jgi:acyl-CoA synthetase (AMP-forming)/AMP-acid ligase II/acyl carrier protein
MIDIFTNTARPSLGSTLYELISAQEKLDPDAAAILEPGQKILTYCRLREQIEYVVRSLNSVGIGRNHRVALMLQNGSDMAVAFLATSAGATSVPLSPDCAESELKLYLDDLDIKALIIDSGRASPARIITAAQEIPIIELLSTPEEAGVFSFDLGNASSERQPICGYAEADDIALILHTSGTTSGPKIVPLSHNNICASAQYVAAVLQLTEQDRCLNVMPLFHVHGLIAAVLASLATGGSVVCTSKFSLSKFFKWLDELLPTWFTAVPTIHQAVLTQTADNKQLIDRCLIRLIRSATSALPPKVMLKLEDAFNVPVIESYGMTETATQITSNPLPPLQRKSGSAGLAAGPDVAIRNIHGEWMPPGQPGEIVVRGLNLMHAYENDLQANQSAFVDGWFRTGDQGYLDSEGYLYITGRLKEMINRGGKKVHPREIDEFLIEHPDILEATAFSVPHPTLGEDLAAAVVVAPESGLTESAIRTFAFEHLADYKVPSQVLIVDAIPRGATGKLKRIGLAKLLSEQLDRHYVAPRNDLEQTIADVFSEVLGLDRIDINDNFFTLGGDSIRGTQVIGRLQACIQVELPIVILFQKPTVAELSEHIAVYSDYIDSDSISGILAELETLSDEDAIQLLAEELGKESNGTGKDKD